MKTAFITGVGKGIGRALLEKFLKEGFYVIGAYHTAPPPITDPNFHALQLDLTDRQSIERCCEAITQLGKKIDVLINNAGILVDEDETKVHISKLRETLEVNLIGTIDLTEHLVPLLSSSAHIVNASSSAGSLEGATDLNLTHYPYHYPAYKISKTALNMYTRTLANRFSNENLAIIVSSVHPGWVKTDMGGEEAPMEPKEAANDIYTLATSQVESGQFWHKGERLPW